MLGPQYLDLADFYYRVAAQVGPPAHGQRAVTEIIPPASLTAADSNPDGNGTGSYDPDTLWVHMHLEQLGSHAASLSGPAARLALVRRPAWWHSPPADLIPP